MGSPLGDQGAYLAISWLLLVGFTVAAIVLLVVLVVVRAVRDLLARRRARAAEVVRSQIFEVVMGDEQTAARGRAALAAARGRAADRLDQQVFEMLPKLRGESRTELVGLLMARGAEQRALALVGSRSSVRRCRGAFQLGMLGLTDHVGRLIRLLRDRHFLVRRVTVRALGAMGDPRAVRPLLELGEHDPRLTRDLVFALDRLGPDSAPELRAVLREEMDRGEHLHLDPAAVVLGLLADRPSVDVLSEGMLSPNPSFAGACAEALGRIGAPEAIPALVEALLDLRPNVRASAAHALGSIGSSVAAASLLDVVDEEEPQVSRQAAQALLELGAGGRRMLTTSSSPYAVEALALDRIRGDRS